MVTFFWPKTVASINRSTFLPWNIDVPLLVFFRSRINSALLALFKRDSHSFDFIRTGQLFELLCVFGQRGLFVAKLESHSFMNPGQWIYEKYKKAACLNERRLQIIHSVWAQHFKRGPSFFQLKAGGPRVAVCPLSDGPQDGRPSGIPSSSKGITACNDVKASFLHPSLLFEWMYIWFRNHDCLLYFPPFVLHKAILQLNTNGISKFLHKK